MKTFIFAIFMMMSSAMATPQVLLGSLPGRTFNAVINDNDPSLLAITDLKTNKTSKYNFKHTISDIKNLTLKVSEEKSQEMLLVVLVVANTIQSAKIFIPVPNTEISLRGKRLSPICEFTNHGSFLGEDDQELQGKFQVKDKKLMVKIGVEYDGTNPVKYEWKECFSF